MDDIVSYIYDEIGSAERMKFETHLAGCSVCTDEFAAISNARFSVFEWRREEFADLQTPEIVIPYPAKSTADTEIVSVGFLAGIRGWLSFVNFPIAVAAGLVLCIGLGFLITTYLGNGEQQFASNAKNVLPAEIHQQTSVLPKAEDIKKPEVAVKTEPSTVRQSDEIRQVKAAEYRRPKIQKQLQAGNSGNRNAIQNIPNAPVLSENYEEADDRSLRLSDLFADVDG